MTIGQRNVRETTIKMKPEAKILNKTNKRECVRYKHLKRADDSLHL
uniref:Uncharacterized protein n=1 Tax=Arundo donax TaxID=35708 RepID=A0A0A9HHT0_ARUDO